MDLTVGITKEISLHIKSYKEQPPDPGEPEKLLLHVCN